MPKFKGNQEDWLDEEDDTEGSSQGGRTSLTKKKKRPQRPPLLPPEEANAWVAEVFPKQCRVIMDDPELHSQGQSELLCNYRRAGMFGDTENQERERTPVAVGDRVVARKIGESDGIVDSLCQRKNRLLRPAPGREEQLHVIASNVDLLVVVASVAAPDFAAGLLDRYLVAAEAAGIAALVCISKADLWDPKQTGAPAPWRVYADAGYELVEVSSKTGEGIAALRANLARGGVTVFCGQSGVGKTSLLRELLGRPDFGSIGGISEATGRGRHTTTGTQLLKVADGYWIDTPGVREFGLSDVDETTLAHCFPELRDLGCPRSRCLHDGEKGCLAIHLSRYASYRRILASLRAGEN